MEAQGHEEPAGRAKITKGYNLPARHVIHTVGPVVGQQVTERQKEELASCYRSCLKLAEKSGLKSIAFCCISTGNSISREAGGPDRCGRDGPVSVRLRYTEGHL